MGLFAKKVKVYEVKGDKPSCKKMKQVLKDAGIRVSTTIWTDEVAGCGCGAKLDNRDFGPRGKIDRDIYTLRVLSQDQDRAKRLVQETFPDYVPYVPKADRLRFSQ